jgi:hypothetical protein
MAIAVAVSFPYMDENTFLDHINIGHYVKERITTDEITAVESVVRSHRPDDANPVEALREGLRSVVRKTEWSRDKKRLLGEAKREADRHFGEGLPSRIKEIFCACESRRREPSSSIHPLQGFLYETGANTSRTNFRAFYCTGFLVNATQFLKVRIPCPLRLIIGVAHIVTDNWLFSTYLANSRHI